MLTKQAERLGCDACWPESAGIAWKAQQGLASECVLIDESHFIVKIRRCPICAQRFVSVFTERIDWLGGDDPQAWTVLPISQAEAQLLLFSERIEASLADLAPDRRALCRLYPTERGENTFWSVGIFVGLHD